MGYSRRPVLQVVLAGLLAVASAGCGGAAATVHKAAPPSASTDPYTASLRYAACFRGHGVPHPDPDRRGDFRLTPADERRMRAVPRSTRKAAEEACFHHLKGLNMSPLSSRAKKRALAVLRRLSRCMHGYGYAMGPPVVKNLSRGRAFFGFKHAPKAPSTARLRDAQHTCEQRVDLAGKIDRIIAEDRSGL